VGVLSSSCTMRSAPIRDAGASENADANIP
jgi:hypothetical protein